MVEGQEIRADEFRRTYQAQLQAYRAAYGGNMNEQLLKQLGVDQQILQQMVDERAALAEADRLGMSVSDEEVRAAHLLDSGVSGERRVHRRRSAISSCSHRSGRRCTTSEFEDSVRRSLVVDKLRASLTEWLSVSDKELEQEYRRRNDKVKLAVVAFNADSYRPDVTASPTPTWRRYFEAHKDDFKIPEKRKVKYLLIDVDALRAKVTVPPADVERAYNENIEQYTTPEQVRASHILLKTEGKDDAAVKAKAEDVLKQAKRGADFAALAKKYSEDEAERRRTAAISTSSARGRMVPEFDHGGVRDGARPDQRPGEDPVRLSHHQADRQEGRHLASHSTKSASSSPISSPSSARRRRPPTLARDGSTRRSRSRPISTPSPRRRG